MVARSNTLNARWLPVGSSVNVFIYQLNQPRRLLIFRQGTFIVVGIIAYFYDSKRCRRQPRQRVGDIVGEVAHRCRETMLLRQCSADFVGLRAHSGKLGSDVSKEHDCLVV